MRTRALQEQLDYSNFFVAFKFHKKDLKASKRMIENMSHIGLDDYKPVALEWYAIIHFWDFLWLITAIFIQIRLSNFREVLH